jgi:serpin B
MRASFQFFLLVAILLLIISGCQAGASGLIARSSQDRLVNPGVPEPVMLSLAESNNEFAFDLYGLLRDRAGNLVFSPYSLSAALAMAFAGASGETEAQMAAALHFDLPQSQLHPAFNQLDLALTGAGRAASPEQHPLQLRTANAIWTDRTLALRDPFLDEIALNYGTGVHLTDFIHAHEAARREINAWVSDQTERHIRDLVAKEAIDSLTRMVLVNAIYFEGDWQHQFDADDTQDKTFHLLGGSAVHVKMMHTHLPSAVFTSLPLCKAVELPYQGGSAVIDIIVPEEGAYEAFERGFSYDVFAEILGSLQPAAVDIGLPTFAFISSFDMGEGLSALGMPDAFDSERADFSRMTGGRDLFVSRVLHQAFVAVDEKGTAAGGATAIIMAPTSMMLPGVSLVVDRPFMFIIRDLATWQNLFIGRVLDPTQ